MDDKHDLNPDPWLEGIKLAVQFAETLKDLELSVYPFLNEAELALKKLEINPLVSVPEIEPANIHEAFHGIAETYLAVENALVDAHREGLLKGQEWNHLVDMRKPASVAMRHLMEQWKIIPEMFQILQKILQAYENLSPRTREAILLLGQHGWYFDLEMDFPELWQLQEQLTKGNSGEVDDALADYFESNLDAIEKAIVEKFPHRKKIIVSAFGAHRRQEYELSIPVLLAQTDGICKEVTKGSLFRKLNKKPQTAIYVQQMSNAFLHALLSPLAETLPIGESEWERGEKFDALNRHLVLHGEAVDYGTRINSLKTISLINYVVHAVSIKPS